MGAGGRASGSISVKKVSGGIKVTVHGGKVNDATTSAIGAKAAKSLENASKSGKVLGPGAVKAIVTQKGVNKTFGNALVGLSGKGGKGTTEFGVNSKAGDVKVHMRGDDGKLKFRSTLEQLRKVAKTKNFVKNIESSVAKTGTAKIANPLKSKSSKLSIEGAKSLASSKQKFGEGLPKLSDMQANKNPAETTQKLMNALTSNSQRAIAKDIAKISEKLGIRSDMAKEDHAIALAKAEKITTASKLVKPLLNSSMSLKQKQAVRDNVRAEEIAKLSANQDVGLAKKLLAKKTEYSTKGTLILVQKNGTAGTVGKQYVPNAETKTINKGGGFELPAGVHFGSFQSARATKDGNGIFLMQDKTRELTGQKAEASANLNRPTSTRIENVGRMFVKAGKQWKEVTNQGLKPVPKGQNVFELVGGKKPPKEVSGPDA